MAETKTCPKYNSTMTQGRILKFNEYTDEGKYIYEFASDDESGPDLSKMFSGNPRQNHARPS